MKRIICLALSLLLCLSLMACGKTEPEAANPLLGTWMLKSPQMEATFTFEKSKSGTSGSYQYFNYAEDTWGEFSFTVKEQSDSSVTLLIDDGTMDVMPYTVIENRLYLDGQLYTNTAAEVPTDASPSTYALLKDGKYYLLYKDIFMGMHLEDVERILGQSLALETEFGNNSHYEFIFHCPYSASVFLRNEDYYNIDLGFDRSKRLVHLSNQATYDSEVVENLVWQLNADFGETYDSMYQADRMNYKWYSDSCVIELQIYWPEGFDTSQFFTITYYFTDKNS